MLADLRARAAWVCWCKRARPLIHDSLRSEAPQGRPHARHLGAEAGGELRHRDGREVLLGVVEVPGL